MQVTGKMLARKWGIAVEHALYHHRGRWFHLIERYPAALFDPKGFVRITSRQELESTRGIQIGQHLHVPDGISSLAGYESFPVKPNSLT